MQIMDKTALWQHIQRTPRHAARFHQVILPTAVYADPCYPQQAVIVEMPFDLPFRCESIFWETSKLSKREGYAKSDLLGIFAVFTAATLNGTPLIQIVFFAEEVFLLFRKWVYFVYPKKGGVAKNLIKSFYAATPHPHVDGYDAKMINVSAGCVFADHPHLRKVLPSTSSIIF